MSTVTGYSSSGLTQYTSGTSISVNAGNLIYVFLNSGFSNSYAPTDSQGNTYTSVGTIANTSTGSWGGYPYIYLWSTIASTAGTITISGNSSPPTSIVLVYVLSNASLISYTSGSVSTAGNYTTTPTTITSANELSIIFIYNSPSSSYLTITGTNYTYQNNAYLLYNPSIGSTSLAFTQTISGPNTAYETLTFAFNPVEGLGISGNASGYTINEGTSGVVTPTISQYSTGTGIAVTAGQIVWVSLSGVTGYQELPSDNLGSTYTSLGYYYNQSNEYYTCYAVISSSGTLNITPNSTPFTSTILSVAIISGCSGYLTSTSAWNGSAAAGTYYTPAVSVTQYFEYAVSVLYVAYLTSATSNGWSALPSYSMYNYYNPPLGTSNFTQEIITSSTGYLGEVLATFSNASTQVPITISGTSIGYINTIGTSTGSLVISASETDMGQVAVAGTSTGSLVISGNISATLVVSGTSKSNPIVYPITTTKSTLWTDRTFRRNIDIYQGTTPSEEVAGFFFWPTSYTITQAGGLVINGQSNISIITNYSQGSISISGTASGNVTISGVSGTSNGSLSISGQAAGTFTSLISGTSNASISILGQVVGALGETGISNGVLSITGQGIGNRGESGTSTGSLSLSGQVVGALGNTASSNTSLLISGQVVGVLGESGTSNASISLSGQVVGALGNTASSNALSLSITGAASGNWFSGVSGISNGSISITGSSNGNIIDYVGTSNGTLSIIGNINAAIKIIGTSSNTLNIAGSSTGSIIDYVGTSNGSLLLSGQVIGNRGVNVLSSNNALNITGSANGNLIDYIGTSNAILSITGNINAVRGVNVLSSNNTIAITGSSNGNIIDYIGTSNAILSITGNINAVRGVVASSIGEALSLAGFVYANIGNGGHSNGSISITAVSSGNVINFIGGSSNTLPIITGSGNGALGNNASSNDTLFITGSITGYFIPPVLGSSSASLPSISGQITAYLVSAGYSNCYIFITGSSEGLTAGTYVEVNWTYVVNPPARSWVAEEPVIIYLMNPKARSWIVSPEITRNFIVNPPSRSFNVLTVI
jgi:hypothetical protein